MSAQTATTVRVHHSTYWPMLVFLTIGGALLPGGIALGVRFLYYWLEGLGIGNVQSLLPAVILTFVGIQSILVGFLRRLAINSKPTEYVLRRVKRVEFSGDATARGEGNRSRSTPDRGSRSASRLDA